MPSGRRRPHQRARGRGTAAQAAARPDDARWAARRSAADRRRARDVGLDPASVQAWGATEPVQAALQADIDAARSPSRSARALDHKLGGPRERRRYTAPSYEISRAEGESAVAIPGFNPVETYETAIANLAPELVRRTKPATVEELLAWAAEPLATAEIAAVTQLKLPEARAALSRVARPLAAGADLYWTLDDA